MAIIDNKMLIMKIAREYYLDGLSQQEIANKENLHRTQVSRALKNARERGFVKIEIVNPKCYDNEELEEKIQSALRLTQVRIAPECDKNDFFSFAAESLEEVLLNRKNVGIGWGTTIYQTASKLYYQTPAEHINFYAVSGTSGTNKAYLQTNSLVHTFSQCFHGTGNFNNFYPYVLKKHLSSLELKRYEEMKRLWKKLDTVVLSVGGPLREFSNYYEEFPSQESLKEFYHIPHGEMLGYLFTENGSTYSINPDYLITSISPALLRQIPDVICIAKGQHKINSIISAARQDYINTLITDLETGREIAKQLNLLDSK